VFPTVLANLEDLAALNDWQPTDLQSQMYAGNASNYTSLVNKAPRSGDNLGATIEQLFQNFTVSLLSSSYLR
jgi:hypothetical protein